MSLFAIVFGKIEIVSIGGHLCNKLVITISFVGQILVFDPKLISAFSMAVEGVPIISDLSDLLLIGQLFFINLI
jgi:hypothetical protein